MFAENNAGPEVENTFIHFLLRSFNQFNEIFKKYPTKVESFFLEIVSSQEMIALTGSKDISAFDHIASQISNKDFLNGSNNYLQSVYSFLAFQKFLYTLRDILLVHYGIEEKYISLEKQRRLISPGEEAFIHTGNNNLNINENKNVYSLIFD